MKNPDFSIFGHRDLSIWISNRPKKSEDGLLSSKWGSIVAFIGPFISESPILKSEMRSPSPTERSSERTRKGVILTHLEGKPLISLRESSSRSWDLRVEKIKKFCEKKCVFFEKIDFWPHFFDLGIKNESFFDPFLAHSGVAKLAPDACEAILRPFFSKLEKKDHVWSARARKISKKWSIFEPKNPVFCPILRFFEGANERSQFSYQILGWPDTLVLGNRMLDDDQHPTESRKKGQKREEIFRKMQKTLKNAFFSHSRWKNGHFSFFEKQQKNFLFSYCPFYSLLSSFCSFLLKSEFSDSELKKQSFFVRDPIKGSLKRRIFRTNWFLRKKAQKTKKRTFFFNLRGKNVNDSNICTD